MAKQNQAPAIDDEPLVKAGGAPEEIDDAEDEIDEDDEDDDGVADEDEDAAKSDLTEDTLVKALDEMDNVANATANGVNPRERELAAKLATGTPLNKSERAELSSFADDTLVKSNRETFMDDPKIAQGFEVSDFLDAALTKVAEALDDSRQEMTKSFSEVGEFNRALAKSLNALGAVVIAQDKEIRALKKSLGGETRTVTEAAPAKGATGRSAVGQRVNDSGAIRKSGNGSQPVALSRPVILATLDEAIEKSEGKQGIVDGIDLVFESSRYETTHLLSPDAMRLVCKARGIDPASVGLNG